MMSALRKNSQTLTGEPKKATCPLQSRRILSKAWKISLLGWWMVTTTALPVPAISWRLLRISRDEAESRPIIIYQKDKKMDRYRIYMSFTLLTIEYHYYMECICLCVLLRSYTVESGPILVGGGCSYTVTTILHRFD